MRFHGVPREAQETPFKGILTQLHPSKEEAHKSTHRLGDLELVKSAVAGSTESAHGHLLSPACAEAP